MPSPIPLSLTVAVFGFSIFLSFSTLLQAYPELAIGITYDLALTAPFFYFLAIRKTRIPKFTVAAVFGLGLLSANYLLPDIAQFHVGILATYVLPAVELAVTGFIGLKTFKAIRAYGKIKNKSSDLKTVFEEVADEVFGKTFLSKAVAFEMSLLAYAFLPLRKFESAGSAFSYHRLRGTNALFAALIFVFAAEAIVLHFVIIQWSVVGAWLLTLSSVYLVVMLFAQLRAIRKRPIEVFEDSLIIRCGLFCEAEIPFDNIASVESSENMTKEGTETFEAVLLKGLESTNLVMDLKHEAEAAGPYWISYRFKRIAFFVDQKDEFLNLIPQK